MSNVDLGDVILHPEKLVAIRRRNQPTMFGANQTIEVLLASGTWAQIDTMQSWWSPIERGDDAKNDELKVMVDARYAEFCEKLGFA